MLTNPAYGGAYAYGKSECAVRDEAGVKRNTIGADPAISGTLRLSPRLVDKGQPRWISFGGTRADAAVSAEVLNVVRPAGIEAAIMAHVKTH